MFLHASTPPSDLMYSNIVGQETKHICQLVPICVTLLFGLLSTNLFELKLNVYTGLFILIL